jgi:hypothetical protein
VRAIEIVAQIKCAAVKHWTGYKLKQNKTHENKQKCTLITDLQLFEELQNFRYLSALINSEKCFK